MKGKKTTQQDEVEITKFEGQIASSPGLPKKNENLMELKDAATGHEVETKIIKNPEVKKRNTAMEFRHPTHFLGKGHL